MKAKFSKCPPKAVTKKPLTGWTKEWKDALLPQVFIEQPKRLAVPFTVTYNRKKAAKDTQSKQNDSTDRFNSLFKQKGDADRKRNAGSDRVLISVKKEQNKHNKQKLRFVKEYEQSTKKVLKSKAAYVKADEHTHGVGDGKIITNAEKRKLCMKKMSNCCYRFCCKVYCCLTVAIMICVLIFIAI